MKLKQITSMSVEGLDIKWIAIMVVGALGLVGVGGVTLAMGMLGPALLVIKAVFCFLAYKSLNTENNKLESKLLYTLNYLDNYNLSYIKKLKTEDIKDGKADIKSYGPADVYEVFNNKIIL